MGSSTYVLQIKGTDGTVVDTELRTWSTPQCAGTKKDTQECDSLNRSL